MANVINGTSTGSGGLITTGDSSDELQLQTAETTAITITSGQQSAFIAGTASAPAVTTTGDLNTGVFFPAADNIGFATGGTIRGRWTTAGLCFGSDTAAANALDDYEEGTFTPTFGGWNGLYSVQQGNYLKIGKLVFLNGQATTVADASKSFVGTGGFMYFDTVPFAISQPTSQINGVWHLATASNTTASLFKFGFWDSTFPNNAVDGSTGTGRGNFAVGNLSPSTAVNIRFMFTYIAS